jgi:sugar phosphate isomerase/epimerase
MKKLTKAHKAPIDQIAADLAAARSALDTALDEYNAAVRDAFAELRDAANAYNEALDGIDPRHVGVCFDIGHATLEGGLCWPLHARRLQDRLVAVFCKDFFWEKTPGGQKPRWCRLGDGVVQKSFFDWLKTSDFSGPISQHHEYNDLGTGAEMVKHLRRDLKKLRDWVAD